ncbi:MAG: helix-turn-helix domain-containing protein [Pseudodonghicola sp.]
MKHREHYHFPENLRIIVQSYSGTSRAAQEFGISRQQLNKYLSGRSMPSIETLQIIASAAGLRPDDLLLPPQAFMPLWQPPLRLQGLSPRVEKVMNRLFENMAQTKDVLAQYCGAYHMYGRLLTNPDRIGRTYSVISQDGTLTLIKMVMYIDAYGQGLGARPPIKVEGVVQWLGERIYIVDLQDLGQRNARLISFVIDPPALPYQPYLTGSMTTTNNSLMREAYTIPIVCERLQGPRAMKADLKACGVFHKDNPQIAPEVRRMLGESRAS